MIKVKSGSILSRLKIVITRKPIHTLILVYLLLVLIATAQSVLPGLSPKNSDRWYYFKYNNYIIFEQANLHLMEGMDLYKAYPDKYEDLYKYSPTFALLFGPFRLLPSALGLFFWNLTNAFLLLFSVFLLPTPDLKKKGALLLFISVELLTSLQNSQSNAILAALIIFTFVFLERKSHFLATLSLMVAVFIKPFAIAGLALFLLYPEKIRSVGYSLFWFLLLLLIPLLFIDVTSLSYHYEKWFASLEYDHTNSYGISIMGWLHSWFGFEIDKRLLVVIGWVFFMIPFIRYRRFSEAHFRTAILSSLLIWVVIFNHKAESATFIIAMAGIAIWFFSRPSSKVNLVLIILAFILTSLSPTDLFHVSIRDKYLVPYCIKVFPCIIIWVTILTELSFRKTPRIS